MWLYLHPDLAFLTHVDLPLVKPMLTTALSQVMRPKHAPQQQFKGQRHAYMRASSSEACLQDNSVHMQALVRLQAQLQAATSRQSLEVQRLPQQIQPARLRAQAFRAPSSPALEEVS